MGHALTCFSAAERAPGRHPVVSSWGDVEECLLPELPWTRMAAHAALPNHESRSGGAAGSCLRQGGTWGLQDGQAGRTLGGWQDTWGKSKGMSPLLRCSSQTR